MSDIEKENETLEEESNKIEALDKKDVDENNIVNKQKDNKDKEANEPKEGAIKYFDLTPSTEYVKGDEAYFDALEWAINNDKALNIALTGNYGSGKSSIIAKFKKEKLINSEKLINVSLASFASSKENCNEGKSEKEANEKAKSFFQEQEIEKSILQQIFYSVKPSDLPYSRFRRIEPKSYKELAIQTAILMLFICLGIFVFVPDIGNNLLMNMQQMGILPTALFGTLLVGLVFYLLKYLSFKNLSKINASVIELSIDREKDNSIINKYLDEIIYFFEATKTKVVVIEDLDRFDSVDIFSKLRELNMLINNSPQVEQKVKFIYAVKDHMFCDKDRTKFFDFIIPVVPVVDSSNSAKKLEDLVKEIEISKDVENKLIESSLFKDISAYINDMRVLKNIINEFKVYYLKLKNSDMDIKQLFAIIVYKNLLSESFSKLQQDEGCLYNVCEIWKKYINQNNDNKGYQEQEKNTVFIENDIQKIELIKIIENIESGNIEDSLEIKEPLLKDLLKKGYIDENYKKYISIFYNNGISRSDSSFFDYIQKEFDTELDSKFVSLNLDNPAYIVDNLLEVYFEDERILNYDLLEYLLENKDQYINKTQFFINQICNAGKLDTNKIISWLEEDLKDLINMPRGQIYRGKKLDFKFTYKFLKRTKYKKEFISLLIETYPTLIDEVLNNERILPERLMMFMCNIVNYIDEKSIKLLNDNKEFISYIGAINLVDFLVKSNLMDFYKVKFIFNRLNIKVNHLDVSSLFGKLSTFVIEDNYYAINNENIKKILQYKLDIDENDISAKNYTSIQKSIDTQKSKKIDLISYIEENINIYVKEVLLKLEGDSFEDEEYLIKLLNNEKIDIEDRKKLIDKSKTVISDVSQVKDERLREKLIKDKKVSG